MSLAPTAEHVDCFPNQRYGIRPQIVVPTRPTSCYPNSNQASDDFYFRVCRSKEDTRQMFIRLKNHYWAKECGANYFIFHESHGEPFLITSSNFTKLMSGDVDATFGSELASMGLFANDRAHDLCKTKSESHVSSYSGPIVLDLVLSETCNLNCHMCSHAQTTHQSHDRAKSKKVMSIEVAKAWIDYYVDYFVPKHKLTKCVFHYGAAEPLINKKVFIETLEYVHFKTTNKEIAVEQLVNTNLTLLDDEIVLALKTHAVKVSVGLDGLATENDLIRLTKRGAGTFHTIVKNIEELISQKVSVGVALTLTERNFTRVNGRDFLTFMKNLGVTTVLVDSDFIHHIPFEADTITDKLMEFYRLGEELGIEILGSWRTSFANLTTENDSEPKSFCTSLLGKNLTVTPSGNLTFCTYSGTPLSMFNVERIDVAVCEFVQAMKQLMSKRLPTLNAHCEGCPISGLCNGGCYLTFEVTGKRKSMCDVYLSATEKLIDHEFSGEIV